MSESQPPETPESDSRVSALDSIRRQRPQTAALVAKRSPHVALLKYILPVLGALILLILIFSPDLQFGASSSRVTYHLTKTPSDETSQVFGATYHGRDKNGEPYTIVAASAEQSNGGNVTMNAPQGSLALKSGNWLMLQANIGHYQQKLDLLGLVGNVTLYRNDGIVLTTRQAQINLKADSAISTDPVEISGAFGVLNSKNGFTLSDHGAQINFHGPTTVVLKQIQ